MDVKDFLVSEEATIIEAMELLDQVAKKVLFVENNEQLTAAITDGDIRRWILKKGSLEAKVKEVANYKPIFLYEKDKDEAIGLMKKKSVEAIPICNDNKQILFISLWNDAMLTRKKKLNIPVVIMAGGLGSRLYPYTKILPKPLIPIGDIPIAEHIMNKFYANGCKQFFLLVNHKKNMIKAYFNEIIRKYEITFVDEEKPLGTGGGLSLLKGMITSTFILSNCDIIILEDYEKIYKFHKKERNLITMVCSLKNFKIPYGVIDINDQGEIISMKEKPELSFITNTGMYIVEPQVIKELQQDQPSGFPEIIESYRLKGEKIGVYPISEQSWLDMGQFEELDEMKRRLEYVD